MKSLLLTSVCAAFVVGGSSFAFAETSEPMPPVLPSATQQAPAEQQAPTMQHPSSAMQQPTSARQSSSLQPGNGGQGAWPSHWAKSDEQAATDALNELENHGYSTFSNFHKKGNAFEATVTEQGRTIQVLVDPATKTVTQES
jgi:hypothetical protein